MSISNACGRSVARRVLFVTLMTMMSCGAATSADRPRQAASGSEPPAVKATAIKARARALDAAGVYEDGLSAYGRLARMAASGRLHDALARARQPHAQQTVAKVTPPFTGHDDGTLLPGGQSDMAVAVDASGNNVVVVFNDGQGYALSPVSVTGYAYSGDAGVHFTDGGALPSPRQGTFSGQAYPQVHGDPDIKYVPGGAGCQFVAVSIAVVGINGTGVAPNIAYGGTAQTLVLHRSTDCGHTWAGPFEVTAATNPTGVILGGSARDAADRPSIDVDPDTGRVMVAWSNFTSTIVIGGGAEVRTARSDNVVSGTPPTWSASAVLNGGASDFDTGAVTRFAGNGSSNVYVAWARKATDLAHATSYAHDGCGNTMLARSLDNGVTWSAPVPVYTARDCYGPMDEIPGNDRIHSLPSLAVDNSGGVAAGNVYIVYASNDTGDGGDIYFQRSADGGLTFDDGTPFRMRKPINACPYGCDRAQWFPSITVTSTGRIYVIWYDQHHDASGDVTETMMTYSDDAGAFHWTRPAPLSVRPFHAGYGNDASQPNLGERLGVTTHADQLYAAWAGTPASVSFADGEPGSASFTVPSLLFKRINAAPLALQLQSVEPILDSVSRFGLLLPLLNYVYNPDDGAGPFNGVQATLTTSTPGVTVLTGTAAYGTIHVGDSITNATPFVVSTGALPPGTRVDLSLTVTANEGTATLPFTLLTGTPHFASLFAETFDQTPPGSLPSGWSSVHIAGMNVVPWTVTQTFCNSATPGLFHQNANDAADPSRHERALSPPIAIPAGAQSVRLSMRLCYNLEDDPDFHYRAYDGFAVKIIDETPGRIPRAVHPEAFADSIRTHNTVDVIPDRHHFPKHLPRSANPAYMQDTAVWSGESGDWNAVLMDLPGMQGSTVRLGFDFSQDESGDCTNVRSGPCGAFVDAVALEAVTYDPATAQVSIRYDPHYFPPTEAAGSLYAYSFAVTANPANLYWASNVVFTSTLPTGTEFDSVGAPSNLWHCTSPPVGAGGTVSCALGAMSPGDSATLTIYLRVAQGTPPGTSCAATATVTTNSPQDTSDDQASTPACVVTGVADLVATLTAPPTATAGADLTYRLTVFDKGPSNADAASLSFATPVGTTFVSTNQVQGPGFACTSPAAGSAGTVTCTAPTLGVGQGAAFDITVHVVDTVAKLASVTVVSTTADPAPLDNTATGLTQVTAARFDLTVGGTGAGRVTSRPAGVDCTASCNTTFGAGVQVSLNAAASAGSRFTGWSGACTGTGACLVTMDAARSVTATFVTGGPTFTLTVTHQGSGSSGVINSVPSGIACGLACSASYAAGDLVTLTAADDERATFVGWTGACSGTGACTVTMSAAQGVGADFALVPSRLEAIDFDRDGRSDLVFRSAVTHETLLAQMSGTQVVSNARMNLTADWRVTHTGDFDGDGKTDLVWRNDVTGETALWLMDGTTFVSGQLLLALPQWEVTHVGDFDGDGKTDLVWRNAVTGETAIWLMDGTSMRSGAIVMGAPWEATHVGDFDGNGKADLVWRNRSTGETAISLMNGTALAGGGIVLGIPEWSVGVVGDFDGDGKSDLVWRNFATGETAIWLMNGAAYAGGAVVLVNRAWAVTHAADLDGDGRADLVWHNGATGETALWLMHGTARGATAKLTDTQDHDLLRTADLNGDGMADFVWRNRVTGEAKVELMNGLTRLAVSPFTLQPVEWIVQ